MRGKHQTSWYASSADNILIETGMLCGRLWTLRRKYFSGPLLLLGVAVCLFYQTLMVARSCFKASQAVPNTERNKSAMTDALKTFDELLLLNPARLISAIETLQRERDVQRSSQRRGARQRAVVLTGRRVATDTEVQLYQRVLEERGFEVSLSRYAETSSVLRSRHGASRWSVLLCLSGSEMSCTRKVSFSQLQSHQRVNMIPVLTEVFSGTGRGRPVTHLSGLALPTIHSGCASATPALRGPIDVSNSDRDTGRPSPCPSVFTQHSGTVSAYVLVTSAAPLTAFLHRTALVRANEERDSHTAQLTTFLGQHFGLVQSYEAIDNVKDVIGQVLKASVESHTHHRCLLCYQLMTFNLQFNGSLLPAVVKVETGLHFEALKDPAFDGQIAKEFLLEDTLHFLLPEFSGRAPVVSQSSTTHTSTPKYGGCEGTQGLCLPEDEILLLLQFTRQLRADGPFELLYPVAFPKTPRGRGRLSAVLSTAEGPASGSHLSHMLNMVTSYYQEQRNLIHRHVCTGEADAQSGDVPELSLSSLPEDKERCVDPHLRQLYTDPPLTLSPAFSPWLKEYRAEVPFDVVTLRIQPEPVSPACHIHLDEHRGPRTANYPVGLGNSRINILVTDESAPEPGPVVMTIYTLHMYRESRPSLPMFGEHLMCGFVQDCGLVVQPGQPCGLEPLLGPMSSGQSQAPSRPCSSGDVPGRWVVPCLSCADNRTCDWREVTWRPEGCQHAFLEPAQLQACMMDRKVLFIGDSTNRGMMYFLMERVNGSLEDWGKAHHTLVYSHLNQGHTQVSYSYYPQFWLEKSHRPTFQEALEQLLHRSQPLENSGQTVLVVGGVQWLNTNHLRTIREVLEREGLEDILVVVKSLGMGFHLPVDGIRSLSLKGIQELYQENGAIMNTAKNYGYEVIDTFSITMGRYKEFLQGRCACHFHEVEKLSFSKAPLHRKMKILRHSTSSRTIFSGAVAGTVNGDEHDPLDLDPDQWAGTNSSSYHVRGAVNQVYSEILLSRLCPRHIGN